MRQLFSGLSQNFIFFFKMRNNQTYLNAVEKNPEEGDVEDTGKGRDNL